ncbi:hypothetical protein [Mycobacterium talmoniae]|uniref:Hemophore-related protein n=1 Tax=Mycobacterium talmoniae TaxID=1858794 RepID=A0A1S1NIU4_9MYCO|nr:hypothetical protein [Mycobacterium talmoniae]OHV01578.1 hypothetical protein BKN37_16845 [Mycobacterium talmoniae]PQM49195.1 hypothetical protein C1Y40_00586 [Mycobacterium talmoniae]
MSAARVGLAAMAAAITWALTAPAAVAQDPECDIILPAANRLEAAFNLITADPPPNVGTQVQTAQSPLFGLTSPAAIDLRLWSSTVADQLNGTNPYHAADLDSDLRHARQELVEARQYCAP